MGRSRGVILFPDDTFVSPHHATLSVRDGRLYVRDDGSVSGLFVSIAQEAVAPRTEFVVGRHRFRFAGVVGPPPPYVPGQVSHYGAPLPPNVVLYAIEELLVGGRPGRAVVTSAPALSIGQAGCDIVCASAPDVAPRHCEVTPTSSGAMVRDLSGGLGTFVRVHPGLERQLQPGDRIRVGDQVLMVEAA